MTDIIIKDVRLSFPRLWTAQEFKAGDGKPRYDASFLIPKGSETDKAIQAAMLAATTETHGKKAPALLAQWAANPNKCCYTDGDTKEYDGYEGMMALSTHRPAKQGDPLIIDRDKSPLLETDGRPYAGCYVNAKVSIYAQAGDNPGIRASFSVVQFVRDGDAFAGSGKPTAEEFEELAVTGGEFADLM